MIESSCAGPPALLHRDATGAFRLDDGAPVEVARAGEWPVSLGNRRIVQVIDEAALDAMVFQFRADRAAGGPNWPGLLVDFDHFSSDAAAPSRAAGWIEDVWRAGDVLNAKVRWSKSGREAVEGGDYRLVSPVFAGADLQHLGGDRYRATRLVRAAVTNDPNISGLAPLSNRSSTTQPNMNQIAEALGLAAEATEADIVAALATLKERADALEKENAELRAAQLDADMAENADVIGDSEEAAGAAREALAKNRAGALAYFGALRKSAKPAPAPAPLPPIHNRSAAKPPATSPTADIPAEQERLVKETRIKNRCSYRDAFDLALRERPELFAAR